MPASLPPSPRRWPWLLTWLLLTLYFLTPPREVIDQGLDKSNYATYAHFFAHGAQWGADVIPMTGPYGFILYGHTYSGEAYWIRFVGDFLLKAVFAALLLHLFRRAGPGALRWLWLAGVIALVPTVDDLFHDYAVLLAGICLLGEFGRRPNRWSWLAAVLLGFIALFKGTHLVTTAVAFGSVALLGAIERQWRAVFRLAAIYLGSLLFFWVLAGQNPLHLPRYVRDVLDLSSGYNATMGLDEARFIFLAGLTLAGALGLLLAWSVTSAPRTRRAGVAFLLLATFSFIKWKHGFLRADGHVYIFFTATAVIALTALLLARTSLLGSAPPNLRVAQQRLGLALLTLVTGFGIVGSAEFWLWRVVGIVRDVPVRLQDNSRYFFRAASFHDTLEHELVLARRAAEMPQVRNEVGADTIDFFGFEQGLLLLNQLNYHPRPMGGGSFNVVTPRLQRINQAFVADPAQAPRWELLKLRTLDGRLPAADDPLTLFTLLQEYSPVLLERDAILLRRRAAEVDATPTVIERVRARPGVEVAVPAVSDRELLLFTVDAPLSFAGRLRSVVYRPPNLSVRLTSDLTPLGRDFILRPNLVHNPVILSPLLLDSADVLKLFSPAPGHQVRKLRLDAAPGFSSEPFTLTFYRAPRPAPPEETDLDELITAQRHPLRNREPSSVVTENTGIRELNKEPIMLVHAPGSITWDLRPGDQQVIFSYGLMPQSYLDGTTDGVEFNVEVLWPPADGRILFKRMLRPRTVPEDQGMQRVRVMLPPFEPGAQLRIRTHPGPDNDGAYDQSYLARFQIKNGPLVAGQFSGLGVVPVDGKLPHLSAAGIGPNPVYLIHAPDEVALPIPANATTFTAQIGLLPGAYTGGGASDGVEFTLFVVPPDGAREKIWARYVDPVHQSADRGSLAITVPLPKLPAGAQLVIATGVGPHDNRGWDQSYIAQAAFQ